MTFRVSGAEHSPPYTLTPVTGAQGQYRQAQIGDRRQTHERTDLAEPSMNNQRQGLETEGTIHVCESTGVPKR